jgi:hypothetical protein
VTVGQDPLSYTRETNPLRRNKLAYRFGLRSLIDRNAQARKDSPPLPSPLRQENQKSILDNRSGRLAALDRGLDRGAFSGPDFKWRMKFHLLVSELPVRQTDGDEAHRLIGEISNTPAKGPMARMKLLTSTNRADGDFWLIFSHVGGC